MKDERYFTLRAHLYDRETDLTCTFKLEELEAVWYCTRKNVKRILMRLQKEGLIHYTPGKGRGNPSTLTFMTPFQQEISHFVKRSMDQGHLDEVAQLLRLPLPKNWIVNASSDIRKMFGYQQGPTSKDILHSFISRRVMTLDPLKVAISLEAHLIEQLGDPLVTYDSETDQIRPHLAHHYTTEEEGRIWTFYLRKGVRFHHDEEMTSRDVEATLLRTIDGPSSYAWMLRDIKDVQPDGLYKVTIYLEKPNPFFIRYLASPNLCILPHSLLFNENEWIATGPFRLKERKSQKLVLEAHDRYFKERPLLDEIHLHTVPSDTAELVNFTIEDENPAQPMEKHEIESGFRFLAFNFHKQNIIQKPSFRRAIFHLLNMKEMAKALDWEDWIEASSFHFERSFHQNKDADQILPLLKRASYQGETIHVYHLVFQRAFEEASWFKNQAAKYGLVIELHPFSFDDFYEMNMEQHADLIFMGEVSSLDPHLSFLGAFYNETLLFRRLFPEERLKWIDQHLTRMKREENKQIRESIMKKIEQYIREHDLLIFQHHPIKTRTFHPMIQDATFQSFGHFDFSKLWVK
ncbi:hypothetical protein EQV77_06040 [Halobacillus fulvus]|nr:hypothetical protein EQV77_06040 [Halobacillus fulvus]